MKDLILAEIKRIAAENGGTPPGQNLFSKLTGINPAKWRGVHWLKWSDALSSAGFAANEWNHKLATDEILEKLAALTQQLGRLPTRTEIKMQRRTDTTFPSHSTVDNHFRTNADLTSALLNLSRQNEAWADLASFLVAPEAGDLDTRPASSEGIVYLLKSGQFYKIGRSEDIERRFREVKIALPEAVTLIHTIRTDDPAGIEAYWHRRFASKRANGEWFALSGADVKAFCRRTFQ